VGSHLTPLCSQNIFPNEHLFVSRQMLQSLRGMLDRSLLCPSLKMVTSWRYVCFQKQCAQCRSLCFSDIFTPLQTAALDGVKLWDLRKLRNFRTFSPYDSDTPTNSGKELFVSVACSIHLRQMSFE
jgi:hypothetical protein